MKLNRIEKFLKNNSVLSFVQRNHEAAMMEKLGGRWLIVHWHSSAPRRAPSPSPKR